MLIFQKIPPLLLEKTRRSLTAKNHSYSKIYNFKFFYHLKNVSIDYRNHLYIFILRGSGRGGEVGEIAETHHGKKNALNHPKNQYSK